MAPELYLAGYPPEDLVLKPAFQEACRAGLRDAWRARPPTAGRRCWSGCRGSRTARCTTPTALLDGGRIEAVRFKVDLPNYGVFDEKRVFTPGPGAGADRLSRRAHRRADLRGHLGPRPRRMHPETGGEILLVAQRLALRARQAGDPPKHRRGARRRERPAADLSQPGRRPGRTRVRGRLVRAQRRSLARRAIAGVPRAASRARCGSAATTGWRCVEGPREIVEEGDEADYAACVLGLRDYVENNRFPGVVLGLSGGIDSALCAAMAVDALGRGARARGDAALSLHLGRNRLRDAAACAKALGVRYDIVPIAEPVEGVERALAPMFAGRARDITEENIQSRARGLILMSISNKFGRDGGDDRQQVGNVGRLRHALRRHERRLQSDQGPLQDGGVSPRRLAQPLEAGRRAGAGRRSDPARHHRHARRRRGTAREPEGRGFAAALPDPRRASCMRLVEKEMRVADIVAEGYDPETVRKVERLLYLAEYKRRQSAPGVKVGPKNFGRDRRYPIVNRFRDSGAPAAGAGRGDRAAQGRRGRASGSRSRGWASCAGEALRRRRVRRWRPR